MSVRSLAPAVLAAFAAFVSAVPVAQALPPCGSRRWTYTGCSNSPDGASHATTYVYHSWWSGWHSCQMEAAGPCASMLAPPVIVGERGLAPAQLASTPIDLILQSDARPTTQVAFYSAAGQSCTVQEQQPTRVEDGRFVVLTLDRQSAEQCFVTSTPLACHQNTSVLPMLGVAAITQQDGRVELIGLVDGGGASFGIVDARAVSTKLIQDILWTLRAEGCK